MKLKLLLISVSMCFGGTAIMSAQTPAPAQPTPTMYVTPYPGLVPDAETAEALAAVYFKPLVGATLADQYVFKATLKGKVWIVVGRVKHDEPTLHAPVPIFEIAKSNGGVSRITMPPG